MAIVGVGCLLPGADTVAAFWDLLSSGRDAKSPLPAGRWNPAAAIDHRTGKPFSDNLPVGGFITDYAYDWRRHVVPPKQVEQANPLQFMLLDATEQALADAGYDRKPLDRNRVAVVVGTMFGDEFSQQLNMALRLPEFQRTLRAVLGRARLSGRRNRAVWRSAVRKAADPADARLGRRDGQLHQQHARLADHQIVRFLRRWPGPGCRRSGRPGGRRDRAPTSCSTARATWWFAPRAIETWA